MNNDDSKPNYVIVFDMDETLGHFSQLYTFWNLVKAYLNDYCLHYKYFFRLLDLFPGFLRPNIIKILNIIKKKKQRKICNYVMIYTNNNGPSYWAELIKEYFHYRLKYLLFDRIIGAFKIDGKQIEICRTSYSKSLKDLINCTKLPSNTQICFLDDQFHPEMQNENVLYINIKPYVYHERFEVLAEKFYNKNKKLFSDKSSKQFIEYIKKYTKNYKLTYINKTQIEKNIDYLLTGQIIKKIDRFFKSKPKNVTKRNRNYRNKTLKIY